MKIEDARGRIFGIQNLPEFSRGKSGSLGLGVKDFGNGIGFMGFRGSPLQKLKKTSTSGVWEHNLGNETKEIWFRE